MKSGDETAVVRSYAKVNLTLDVLGKRPDGFHAIESVMQSISLHDTISLRVGGESGIRIECDMPGIPTGEENLAYKAASLLFDSRGIAPGMDIRIEKRITPQAGLGGGSSNAASVLTGLSRLLGLQVSREDLCDLAALIGSDVPFFLVGGTAFVRGRGEEVIPLPDASTWWLVIVKPPFGVSTAWAYRRLDEMRPTVEEQRSSSERMRKCMETEGCALLPTLLENDLELPALERHPEIGEIKQALVDAGARAALMCGSGSAVFGLFGDERSAQEALRALEGRPVTASIARTIGRAEALEL